MAVRGSENDLPTLSLPVCEPCHSDTPLDTIVQPFDSYRESLEAMTPFDLAVASLTRRQSLIDIDKRLINCIKEELITALGELEVDGVSVNVEINQDGMVTVNGFLNGPMINWGNLSPLNLERQLGIANLAFQNLRGNSFEMQFSLQDYVEAKKAAAGFSDIDVKTVRGKVNESLYGKKFDSGVDGDGR